MRQTRQTRQTRKLARPLLFAVCCIFLFWHVQIGLDLFSAIGDDETSSSSSSSIRSCSRKERDAINNALPDVDCSASKYPWQNKCPISQITGCPDTTSWLDRYYQDEYHRRDDDDHDSFVAINIGCNKGFDAVNLLRMGSNDATISRSQWNDAMPQPMLPSNCQQDREESQYQIVEEDNGPIRKRNNNAQVICVEPLTATYTALQNAATTTKYNDRGLTIFQYALNNNPHTNYTLFPKVIATNQNSSLTSAAAVVGAEKEGGGNCYSRRPTRQARLREMCEPVPTTQLDTLVEQQGLGDKRINILLVDVEGWDFEVLKGGTKTLRRTAYLEFEYNWRGKWAEDDKALQTAIDMLDKMDFTCYWPGKRQLWRITGCWLPHYQGLFWSNVVCVNRILAPTLAERMEKVFLETIGNGKQQQ